MNRISPDRLRALLNAHGAALILYARQWCWAPEDAVQEALIELLRQSPAPEHPVAWLFKAVRRRAMNIVRGELRREHHHHRAAEQRELWFATDEDAEFESAELAAMLERLPALEREIVVARIWGELSLEQIAGLVGLSRSAVHRRYHNALSILEGMMQAPVQQEGRNLCEPMANPSENE